MPHVNFSVLLVTFQYLSLYWKDGRPFCWYKSATVWGTCKSWMSSQPLRKSSKSLHINRWKGVLVLSSLETCDDIFLECFIASASSGQFQTSFSRLISCQLVSFLIYPKERLVSQVRPFPFLQLQCWSHIGFKYWKRSALQNRKGLADETKPTVCKHK